MDVAAGRANRVLTDQRRQRVDVIALERRGVAADELALDTVRRERRIGGHVSFGERPASPLQRARDRRDARLEEARDLGGLHRSTSQRMSAARRFGGASRTAATNASRTVSRAAVMSAGSEPGSEDAPGLLWASLSRVQDRDRIGSGRRFRASITSKQTFVAIRYSQ